MRLKIIAALAACVMLAGCATTNAPLLAGAAAPHITKVTVTKAAEPGSVNMAEDLRIKVLRRAPAYAAAGTPKALEINITRVNFKNPVMTLLVGDSNQMNVAVRVVDPTTGKVEAGYDAFAMDAMMINGIAGAVMSAADNPIDVEQRLTEAVAAKLLAQLYGSDAAQRASSKAPANIAANYPRRYEDLKIEANCKSIASANAVTASNKSDPMHGRTGALPPECATVGVTESKPAKRG